MAGHETDELPEAKRPKLAVRIRAGADGGFGLQEPFSYSRIITVQRSKYIHFHKPDMTFNVLESDIDDAPSSTSPS